ncbi:MAG: glycerate kinase [Verrucomicrobiales bacterium]|nr:glycerate kinase [Verrucomicrobiales bacterium]
MADRPLRLLVATDKFKGSLTGPEACSAIATGLRDGLGARAVKIRELPIADGGEGMARAITLATGGQWITTDVTDPLGRRVEAGYGWIDSSRTAVIEMAEPSGLWRVSPDERDPWRASTRGTGELMRHAIEVGAQRLLLGIGGSATNDGGTGMAAALGVRFLDASGDLVADLPTNLDRVHRIDTTARIALPEVVVACDVTNPLLGPTGCTRVYGPQKGLSAADFDRHESRLAHLVSLTGSAGRLAAETPGAGAAGGLGFGCLVFCGARLRPGFDLVSEILGLEPAVAEADLVITGEGSLDRQTLSGKGPAGVAELARRLEKPVVAFAGVVDPAARPDLERIFAHIIPIEAGGLPAPAAMAQAAALLRATAANWAGEVATFAR